MNLSLSQLSMAVDNSDVTFILHETCRTCMNINQSQNQLIPIFDNELEPINLTPAMILNEFLFLKLKVKYCVSVIYTFNNLYNYLTCHISYPKMMDFRNKYAMNV